MERSISSGTLATTRPAELATRRSDWSERIRLAEFSVIQVLPLTYAWFPRFA